MLDAEVGGGASARMRNAEKFVRERLLRSLEISHILSGIHMRLSLHQ